VEVHATQAATARRKATPLFGSGGYRGGGFTLERRHSETWNGPDVMDARKCATLPVIQTEDRGGQTSSLTRMAG